MKTNRFILMIVSFVLLASVVGCGTVQVQPTRTPVPTSTDTLAATATATITPTATAMLTETPTATPGPILFPASADQVIQMNYGPTIADDLAALAQKIMAKASVVPRPCSGYYYSSTNPNIPTREVFVFGYPDQNKYMGAILNLKMPDGSTTVVWGIICDGPDSAKTKKPMVFWLAYASDLPNRDEMLTQAYQTNLFDAKTIMYLGVVAIAYTDFTDKRPASKYLFEQIPPFSPAMGTFKAFVEGNLDREGDPSWDEAATTLEATLLVAYNFGIMP
jgi:hypothetical protein